MSPERQREIICRIALLAVPGIGPVRARKLLSMYGSASACFERRLWNSISGIYRSAKEQSVDALLEEAESEVEHCLEHNLQIILDKDDNYPQRLLHCRDAPILLFGQGTCNLNPGRCLAIVGSRMATRYGKQLVSEWMACWRMYDITIVSGLAEGIDGKAHEAALEEDLDTIAVLGHGLDHTFPAAHRGLKRRILKHGGSLLTEYRHDKRPHRMFFPARNRIVAGMVDAVLVVESAEKGGALITADIANSYDRQVLAVPGRVSDRLSVGCNQLVRDHLAAPVQSAHDVLIAMNWDTGSFDSTEIVLDDDSLIVPDRLQRVLNYLEQKSEAASLAELQRLNSIDGDKVYTDLLQLELKGMVIALPGNRFVKA